MSIKAAGEVLATTVTSDAERFGHDLEFGLACAWAMMATGARAVIRESERAGYEIGQSSQDVWHRLEHRLGLSPPAKP